MGRGSERVYAYTFSSYQRSNGRYPIKVGMTRAGSAERRIEQQLGASNAETPILLLEIACENAALLERSLHSRLKSRHVSDAPGKEWFRTTPPEIMTHLRALDPAHVDTLGQGLMVLVDWIRRGIWTVTSGLWNLFSWVLETGTRKSRKRVKRRYRRVKKRAEEALAKVLVFGLCLAGLVVCAT
jgi:hypothetical protein